MSIEVIDFRDEAELRELATQVYANAEPGFQVEGVQTSDELAFVLDSLLLAAPSSMPSRSGFDYAYAQFGDLAALNSEPEKPHMDTSFAGLAVHQNITGNVPVVLATGITQEYYESPRYSYEPGVAKNFRRGITIPGRLTVFSEGGYEELLPTIHFFDRRKQEGERHWVRYAQSGLGERMQTQAVVTKVAEIALEQLMESRNQTAGTTL